MLRPMELRGLSLIGSETGVIGGATFHGFDPARQEKLAPAYHSVSPAELERAVRLAAAAAPAWARLPGSERNRFMRLVADKLDQHVAELAERAARRAPALLLPSIRCSRRPSCQHAQGVPQLPGEDVVGELAHRPLARRAPHRRPAGRVVEQRGDRRRHGRDVVRTPHVRCRRVTRAGATRVTSSCRT